MMSTSYQAIDETQDMSRGANATRLFVLAFISGALVIGLTELLQLGTNEPGVFVRVFGILCPLLIMLIYFTEARKIVVRSRKVTLEQVADSLYFLGFLYTLCALLAALVSLSEIDTANIVSRFGLALVTTIVGLFAKTALTQFQMNEDQAVVQARSTLVSTIDELTDTMGLASKRIDDFVKYSTQQFASGTGQCLETLNSRATQCAEALENHLVESLQQQVEKTGHCIDVLHSSATQSIETLHESISESTRKVAGDYESMVSDSMKQRQEMSKHIVETGKIAREAINGLANDASTACDKLGEKTLRTNLALDSLTNTLQTATGAQRGLLDRVKQMDETLHESANNRKALNTAVMQVAKLSEGLCTGIQTIVEATESQRTEHESRQAAHLSSMEQMIDQWRKQDTSDRDRTREQLATCLDGMTNHLVDESGKSLTISRDLHMALQELLKACQMAVERRRTRTWWRRT